MLSYDSCWKRKQSISTLTLAQLRDYGLQYENVMSESFDCGQPAYPHFLYVQIPVIRHTGQLVSDYIIFWRCTTISELMINEQIRDKEVRLIGENGEQLGIMSARDAYKMAQDAELDLVKIAPTAKPPVCKIIDYGKYRYELARKEKEAKKKQKTVEVKEIRLSPNIETNDLNTKINATKKFISKGNKVKITLRFRGREMAHMQSSKHILDDFAEQLEDVAIVEKAPKIEGRSISMVLAEKK